MAVRAVSSELFSGRESLIHRENAGKGHYDFCDRDPIFQPVVSNANSEGLGTEGFYVASELRAECERILRPPVANPWEGE